jgi:ABC-type branched-subunit amino acid transport system substrate-binding protein
MLHFSMQRRQWLQWSAGTVLGSQSTAFAQMPGSRDNARPVTIAQIVDMSSGQQDVSRDFLTGSRAAWQDLQAKGGIKGQAVQHLVLEVNGTGPALREAWKGLQEKNQCVALSGCVGNALAAELIALQEKHASAHGMAQIAPWLHDIATPGNEETVFDIFPDQQSQLAHALRTLSVMGIQELAVAYASTAVRNQDRQRIEQAAQTLGLRTHTMPPVESARTLTPAHAIVLFLGGTPELHDFVRKLVLQPGRQCYVVALADVNLQVLAQMGGTSRNVSVIATQAVPMVTASLPIVRAYRDSLARLFDEPPSPQGLAGYIAARYTAEVLQGINGPLTRGSVLAAFRRRQNLDLGGFQITFQGHRRSNAYVTQSMLTSDGRIVG